MADSYLLGNGTDRYLQGDGTSLYNLEVPASDPLVVFSDRNLHYQDVQTGTGTYRMRHTATRSVTAVQLTYGNWQALTAGTGDVGTGNSITLKVFIEVSGVATQVLFSGATTVAIADGATVTSDSLTLSIAAGTTFFIRTYATFTGNLPKSYGAFWFADEYYAPGDWANGTGDLSAKTSAAFGPAYGPIKVVGATSQTVGNYNNGLVVIGDSIVSGVQDSFSNPNEIGFWQRALYNGATASAVAPGARPYRIQSLGGESAAQYVSTGAKRQAITGSNAPYLVTTYGINDLQAAATLAQLQASVRSIGVAAVANQTGLKVYQATLLPKTNAANTVTDGINTTRVSFNDWVRDGMPETAGVAVATGTGGALRAGQTGHPFAGYIEIADLGESSRNSGLWANSAWTTDGLHPNVAGNIALASMLDLSKFVHVVPPSAGLTSVTSTRATSWTTRASVAATRATSWTTRASVAATRATSWTALSSALATRAATWNTAASVLATRATTWTTRAAILATRATSWSVLGSVSATRATTWSALASALATRATSWSVAASVASTRATSWNVAAALTSVTATRATTWNTLAPVAGTRTTSWSTLGSALATRATTWNTRTAVTGTRATTWNTVASTSSTRATTWAALSSANASRATSWTTLGSVGATRATTWNVAANLASITSTRATSWTVIGRATATRATSWTVTASVNATRATTWTTRGGVTSSRSTSWSALASTTGTRATTWATKAQASSAKATSWTTRASVTGTRGTSWAVAVISGSVGTPVLHPTLTLTTDSPALTLTTQAPTLTLAAPVATITLTTGQPQLAVTITQPALTLVGAT